MIAQDVAALREKAAHAVRSYRAAYPDNPGHQQAWVGWELDQLARAVPACLGTHDWLGLPHNTRCTLCGRTDGAAQATRALAPTAADYAGRPTSPVSGAHAHTWLGAGGGWLKCYGCGGTMRDPVFTGGGSAVSTTPGGHEYARFLEEQKTWTQGGQSAPELTDAEWEILHGIPAHRRRR